MQSPAILIQKFLRAGLALKPYLRLTGLAQVNPHIPMPVGVFDNEFEAKAACTVSHLECRHRSMPSSVSIIPWIIFDCFPIRNQLERLVKSYPVPNRPAVYPLGCRHTSLTHQQIEQRGRHADIRSGLHAGQPAWCKGKREYVFVLGHLAPQYGARHACTRGHKLDTASPVSSV